MQDEINIKAKNDMAEQIINDIEFGYGLKMIYNKIIAGNYGNEPIHVKENLFEQDSSVIDKMCSQEEEDIKRFISVNKK